jgi:two-component system response regulator/two-component system chemotaxis response regulator CheY
MKTILIAEDDPVMTKLIEFNLKREGYQIITCGDGESVVNSVKDNPPDLALFDLNLPGMSGLELSRFFQNDAELSKIPRIVVTAQGKDAVFDDLYESGISRVFTKPFSPSALAEEIRTLLEQC